MPPVTHWLILVAIAFLAGSIPFGYLIGRAKGVDLRTVGSKNIGATNLGRVFGKKFFFLCFFLDMFKGLIPTAAAGWHAGVLGDFAMPAETAWWWLAVMAASVLGHMFTPWLGFKGGKGVATGLGALLGVFPALTIPGAGAFVVFVIVAALWRYISAASVAAACSLPLWTWYAHDQFKTLQERRIGSQPLFEQTPASEIDAMVPYAGWPFVIVAGVLAALVIYKHRANLARLANGTEPKFGERTAGSPTPATGKPPGSNTPPNPAGASEND